MESTVMQASFADGLDASETLTKASTESTDHHRLDIPVICGVGSLDEGLKMITAGAVALRSLILLGLNKDAPGHNREDCQDIRSAMSTMADIKSAIAAMAGKSEAERKACTDEKGYGIGLLNQTIKLGRFPVPFFADGGFIFPIDAAMARDVGYDGVIASVQLFRAANPEKRMRSMVLATTHYDKPDFLAKITEDHGAVGAI
ncbi:Pyridoxal 5'-phosphate synthase subunit snz1, partial [Coemansia biformis]